MRFKKGNLLFYLQVSLCLFLVLSEIPQSFAKKGKGIKGKGIKGGKGIKAGKGIKGKSAISADGDATTEAPMDTGDTTAAPEGGSADPTEATEPPADGGNPTDPPAEASEPPPDVTEEPPPSGDTAPEPPTTEFPIEVTMESTVSPGGGDGDGGGGSMGTQGFGDGGSQGGNGGPEGPDSICQTDQDCDGMKGLFCNEQAGVCRCRQGVWQPNNNKCSSAEGPMFEGAGGADEGLTDPGFNAGNGGGKKQSSFVLFPNGTFIEEVQGEAVLPPLGMATTVLGDGEAIKGDHCEEEKRCKVEAWLFCKPADQPHSFHQCDCIPGTRWDYEKQECKRTGLPGHRGLALLDEECDSNMDCDIDRALFCNPVLHICVCKPNQQWSRENNICYATGGLAAFASEFEDIPNAPGLYAGGCTNNRHCDTKRGLYCSLAVGQCRCKYGPYNENTNKCEKDPYPQFAQQGRVLPGQVGTLPYPINPGLANGAYNGLGQGQFQGQVQGQPMRWK